MSTIIYSPKIVANELLLTEDESIELLGGFIEQAYGFKNEIYESLAENAEMENFYSLTDKLYSGAKILSIRNMQESLESIKSSTQRAQIMQSLEIFYAQIDELKNNFVKESDIKIENKVENKSNKHNLKESYSTIEEVEEDVQKILKIARESNDDSDWKLYASLVLDTMHKYDNFDKAIAVSEEFFSIAKDVSVIYESAVINYAQMKKMNNELDEAIVLYKEALELMTKRDAGAEAIIFETKILITIYIHKGYIKEAESLEETYIQWCKRSFRTSIYYSKKLIDLANVYKYNKYFSRAIKLYEEAIEILRNDSEKISHDMNATTNSYTSLLRTLADLYQSTDQNDKELKIYIELAQVVDILYQELPDENLAIYLHSFILLGNQYYMQTQFYKAIKVFEKRYSITKELYSTHHLKGKDTHLQSISFLAKVYRGYQMPEEAAMLEQEAAEISTNFTE
ncbi:protein containing Tetratricopeptide repeat (TPR) domain [Sulfurimonas gotlandica GD1]|uniref:Protein containing Tetratricopeptide repeat (TPR) domain n=1 Tax=Sulfurimonas gotlandica (strain DSM 19862 / JCM 16533 / GD1) TaxID=929558 RepID=B6BJ23_SULGG|nr:hypothetical protein [Sulfurimonas gotlandica]EDZ63321.1 tetratricopeptide repeat domain protein [Sulfurimonas gotlandica GD1]EHP30538.1 protein containing Tetratricopeptide repeat (TPR) domain [Sulfurimonas gotlandica GD1]